LSRMKMITLKAKWEFDSSSSKLKFSEGKMNGSFEVVLSGFWLIIRWRLKAHRLHFVWWLVMRWMCVRWWTCDIHFSGFF
jgi:hypothetical protein